MSDFQVCSGADVVAVFSYDATVQQTRHILELEPVREVFTSLVPSACKDVHERRARARYQ